MYISTEMDIIPSVFRFVFLNFCFQVVVASLAPYTQIFLRNKGYSHSFVGVVVAVGQISSILFPLFVSALADKLKRTKILLVALMVISILMLIPSMLIGSAVLTLALFFLSMGFFHCLNPVIDGYQNRMLEGDSRKYGMARSGGTMGYVLALALFSITNFPDETSNISISKGIVITAILFMFSLLFIPNDRSTEEEVEAEVKEEGSLLRCGVFSRRFYLMMLVIGLSRIAHAVPDKLLSSYMVEVLGLGGDFALFVSLGALSEFVMMIVGGILLQKKRTTPYTMILLSCIALVVRLLSP